MNWCVYTCNPVNVESELHVNVNIDEGIQPITVM